MDDIFNVIVSSFDGEYLKGEFILTKDRVFVDNSPSAPKFFADVSDSILSYAAQLPTLFMYESQFKADAHIGKITRAQLRGNQIRILFEFDQSIPPIPHDKAWSMRWELDLGDHEFNRRHWAIKSGSLVAIIQAAGLYSSDHLVDALAIAVGEMTEAAGTVPMEPYRQRIQAALPSDPALAIGATKEMIETVMKTILAQRGVGGLDALNFPDLMHRSLTELGLKSVQPPASDVERNMRQIASGAQKILDAANSLRNVAGTGHGRVAGSEHEIPASDAQFVSALGFVIAAWLLRHHRANP